MEYPTVVDVLYEVNHQAAFYIIILGEFLYGVILGSLAGVGLSIGMGAFDFLRNRNS